MVVLTLQTAHAQSAPKPDVPVFKDSAGHVLMRRQIMNATETVSYPLPGNRKPGPEALRAHQQARLLAAQGQYAQAVTWLEQGMQLEPQWAEAAWEMANNYMQNGDVTHAEVWYRKADELAPKGIYQTKVALFTFDGEASGKFPKGLYTTYFQLTQATDAFRRREIARMITTKIPGYAPAWKELADLTEGPQAQLAILDKALSLDTDPETRGALLIRKADILYLLGKGEAAKQLLGNLIFAPDVTTANAAAASVAFRRILEHK